MFCWQARRSFAAYLEQAGSVTSRPRLKGHLAVCPACRLELEDARRVSGLVGEAGRLDGPVLTPTESEGFERNLMRAIRARDSRPRGAHTLRWLGPAPIAAAASLMLLAALAALMVGSPAMRGTPTVADNASPREITSGAAVNSDTLVAPREIPFTYVQDLVGARRGRMPLTTYVLEPAPDDKAVVRASL